MKALQSLATPEPFPWQMFCGEDALSVSTGFVMIDGPPETINLTPPVGLRRHLNAMSLLPPRAVCTVFTELLALPSLGANMQSAPDALHGSQSNGHTFPHVTIAITCLMEEICSLKPFPGSHSWPLWDCSLQYIQQCFGHSRLQ